MGISLQSTFAYWHRMWRVWRRNIWPSLSTGVLDPLIFLFAFGFGLGAIVTEVDGTPYLSYVIPGLMVNAMMFRASFESTIEVHFRYQAQRTWDAVLATPVSFSSLIAGEMLWAATKGMIACTPILIAGYAFGGVLGDIWQVALALLLCFLSGFCFSACGLLFVSVVKSVSSFPYIFTFWMTPMFVFCGVFFPVDRFPEWIQWLIQIFPATHLIEVVRGFVTGAPLGGMETFWHLSYLILLTFVAAFVATRRLKKRLFD